MTFFIAFFAGIAENIFSYLCWNFDKNKSSRFFNFRDKELCKKKSNFQDFLSKEFE